MITQLSRILTPTRCLQAVEIDSRKRVLETISRTMADEVTDVSAMDLFDLLIARERLGSTAIGNGVAIPHVRCAKIDQPIAVLCQLASPIPYDAKDGQPVDLFFALVVPEEAEDVHSTILSQMATLFRDEASCQALRQAASPQALYHYIMEYEREQATQDGNTLGSDNTQDSKGH